MNRLANRWEHAGSIARIGAIAAVAAWCALAAWAQDASPASPDTDTKDGIEAFSVVWHRNVFDPARRAYQPAQAAEAQASEAPPPPPPPAKTLRLAGTAVSDERQTAFFTGSESAYNRAAAVGDEVAEMKVTRVDIGEAVLEGKQGPVTLPVGHVMTVNPDDTWTVQQGVAQADPPPAPTPAAGTEDTGEAADTDSGSSLLEKLKARRQKELQ